MALLICFLFFVWQWFNRIPSDSRAESILKVGLIIALWAGIGVEVLSIGRLISPYSLALWWAIGAIPAYFFSKKLKRGEPHLPFGLLGILGVYGLQAVYFPPNNYDSMSYHLPRVLTWIQNQEVSFYTTGIARQLYYNPLAEYILVHLYWMVGDDHLLNVLQWAALVGSLLGIKLIIRHLGGDQNTQTVGMLLGLVHPMIGFESTTTQNDLVAGFFLISAIFFTLKRELFWLTLALVVGGWVKYTVWMLYLPWGLYAIWKEKHRLLRMIPLGLILAVITLGPFWLRNYNAYGSPLGPMKGHPDYINVSNDEISGPIAISNTLRTLGNNLSLPSSQWNHWMIRVFDQIHQWLGIDLNAPESTYENFQFELPFLFTEDNAGSLIWLGMVVILGGVGFLRGTQRRIWLGIGMSFLVFNVLLKYQPMHNRLLCGWILLTAVPIAFSLPKRIKLSYVYLFVIFLQIPIWLGNKSKPLVVVENKIRLMRNQPHAVLESSFFEKDSVYLKEFYEQDPMDAGRYLLKGNRDNQKDKELVRYLIDKLQVPQRKTAWMESREGNYFQNRFHIRQEIQKAVDWTQSQHCINLDLMMGFDAMEYPVRKLILNRAPSTQFSGYKKGQPQGDCLIVLDTPLEENIPFHSKFIGKDIQVIRYAPTK